MKLQLLLLASAIAAKNVVDLESLNAGDLRDKRGDSVGEDHLETRDVNSKRDAKNVINLQELSDLRLAGKYQHDPKNSVHEKREPKNVANLAALNVHDKREPKNVVNLAALNDHDKREPKNVVNLAALNAGHNDAGNEKREPKNVVNLASLNAANTNDDSELQKRKNTINLNDFKIGIPNNKREVKPHLSISNFLTTYNQKRADDNLDQFTFEIDPKDSHQNILQSILPQIQDISIFSASIRDNAYVFTKTEALDQVTVIIAPTNDAISHKLDGKKPWEFPLCPSNEKNVEENSTNFLFGHIIENFETNLKLEKQIVKSKLLNGNDLSIKQDVSGKFSIQLNNNDWINVTQVKQVDNGFVFVIDDVLVKPN